MVEVADTADDEVGTGGGGMDEEADEGPAGAGDAVVEPRERSARGPVGTFW